MRKFLTKEDIIIIRNGSDGNSNLVQVTVRGYDTQTLQGAFRHQLIVTDGAGYQFTPFVGVAVLEGLIAPY